MKRLFGATALAGMALAAPATATDWDSVAGWDVYEVDATRCVVGRVFAQSGTSFGIILGVDGEVRVFATGAGWPVRAGAAVDAQVAFDDKPLVHGPSVGIEQQRNRGFVAAADEAMLRRFASASALTLRAGAGAPTNRLPLSGTALGLAQGRRCVASLRDERGRAPQPIIAMRGPPQQAVRMRSLVPQPTRRTALAMASRPVPRGSLSSWVGDADYPAAALRARQEGTTTVKLAINRSGVVSGCEVTGTSGSKALDEETCRIFNRRARYKPALDTAGRPVDSAEPQKIRWQLPD